MIAYLVILTISIVGLTAIGWLLNYGLKIQKTISDYCDFSLAFVIGLFFTQAVYSLIQTRGISINLVLIVISFIIYWTTLPKVDRIGYFNWSILLSIVPFLILVTLRISLFSGNALPTEGSDDGNFNALIAYYINLTGQENEFKALNLLSADYHGTTTYHYTELWLNALISECFDLNYSHSLSFIVHPILYFGVFLLLLSLVEVIKGKVSAVNFLFITGAMFLGSALPNIQFENETLAALNNVKDVRLWYNLRFAPYLIFILGSFIFWIKGQKTLSYSCLIILGILQITPLLSIFPILFLWTFYKGVIKGSNEEKIALYILLAAVLLFFCFKGLTGNDKIYREGTSISDLLNEFFNFGYMLRERINIFLKSGIYLVMRFHILLISVVLFLYYKRDSEISSLIALHLFICLAGLVAYIVLFRIVDSFQIYSNFTEAIVFVLIVYCFLIAKPSGSPVDKLLMFSVMLFISYGLWRELKPESNAITNKSSSEYKNKVSEYLHASSHEPVIGASFKNHYPSEFSAKVTIYTNGLSYLPLLRNGATTVSLSDYQIPIQEDPFMLSRYKSGYVLGAFYRHVQMEKEKSLYESLEISQERFIKQHKLSFGIFSHQYPIPGNIEKLISQEYVDPITKDRFAVFNY